MKTSVVYIVSNIDKALAFEWVATELDKNKFKLSFILLNPGDSHLEGFLKENSIDTYRIPYRGKKDILKAIKATIQILSKEKAAVIHCHLFDASIIGLLAGRIVRVKKNIFTRHYSTQHHTYFPKAVYYDKLINMLATDIVAISGNVKKVLVELEGVKPAKITLIPHGFKLEEFKEVTEDRIKVLQDKYNPHNLKPVIGTISRYTHLKGLQFTIAAFDRLLKSYPDALLILANAVGDYTAEIQGLLKNIPKRNYREIRFEPDIMGLYQLFDVFVHVPIDNHSEAFGQTYVEALAAGIPSVFTLSGIANEFIKDKENALVVDYHNSDAIYTAIENLLEDNILRNKIINTGRKDVMDRFKLNKFVHRLEDLYLS